MQRIFEYFLNTTRFNKCKSMVLSLADGKGPLPINEIIWLSLLSRHFTAVNFDFISAAVHLIINLDDQRS